MGRSFTFQLIPVLLALLTACASVPPAGDRSEAGGDRVTVYVAGHGWHTGIIVPAVDMLARMPGLKTRFSGSAYLEFGWGDRAFYQAVEPGAALAVKAALWPTEAVMHVVSVAGDVEGFYPNSELHRLNLSPDHYTALLDFILSSFRRSKTDEAIPLGVGLYGNSGFYEAVGSYTLFNTCNTWTAKGLKRAGLDINPTFMARASSVMDFLREMDP